MNILAFNMHISPQLRNKFNFGVYFFPFVLMFTSLALLWPFGEWLSDTLNILPDKPIKEQKGGVLFTSILLSAMLIFMLTGYLFGWLLDAFVASYVYKWPVEKVRRVFLFSDVPTTWLKKGVNTAKIHNNSALSWSTTRQKSKVKFVLKNGVFIWGGFMYFFMTILPALRRDGSTGMFYYIWQAVLWGIIGAIFGLLVWYFAEKNTNN